MKIPGAISALAEGKADLPAIDPVPMKVSVVHEPVRQQKNYDNMRKVLASKTKTGESSPTNPFEEDDIAKRFQLLKEQMHVEENASSLKV